MRKKDEVTEDKKEILRIAKRYGMRPVDSIKMMVKEGSDSEQQFVDVPPADRRILFFPDDEQFLLLVDREGDWEIFAGSVSDPSHLEYFLDPGSLQDEGFEPIP